MHLCGLAVLSVGVSLRTGSMWVCNGDGVDIARGITGGGGGESTGGRGSAS